MPPNIEEPQPDNEANNAIPIEHEDQNNHATNVDSYRGSEARSQTKGPGPTGPTFLSRLSQLPIQRPLPWRAGQELPPERSSNSDRVQQRGASLLATRGNVATEPCTQCAAGRGRFTHCITLGNWFQGACSSCVFTSRGNRCTLRLQKGKVDGRSARHQAVDEGGLNENPNPRPKKRRRKTAEEQVTVANIFNPLARHTFQNSSGVAVASPQTMSPDRALEPMTNTEISSEKVGGLLGYVRDTEMKPKMHHKLSEEQDLPSRGHGGSLGDQESPKGQLAHHKVDYGGFTPVNRNIAPSIVRLPAQQNTWPPLSNGNIPLGPPSQSPVDGGRPVHLIDTLPKPKQRQIFGLISGIQGGIDHLQKQLLLLQGSLGIDIEGDAEQVV